MNIGIDADDFVSLLSPSDAQTIANAMRDGGKGLHNDQDLDEAVTEAREAAEQKAAAERDELLATIADLISLGRLDELALMVERERFPRRARPTDAVIMSGMAA